jgi:hypothetical protein
MHKAAHSLGNVDSSNPHCLRHWWLHHHGCGVSCVFALCTAVSSGYCHLPYAKNYQNTTLRLGQLCYFLPTIACTIPIVVMSCLFNADTKTTVMQSLPVLKPYLHCLSSSALTPMSNCPCLVWLAPLLHCIPSAIVASPLPTLCYGNSDTAVTFPVSHHHLCHITSTLTLAISNVKQTALLLIVVCTRLVM